MRHSKTGKNQSLSFGLFCSFVADYVFIERVTNVLLIILNLVSKKQNILWNQIHKKYPLAKK